MHASMSGSLSTSEQLRQHLVNAVSSFHPAAAQSASNVATAASLAASKLNASAVRPLSSPGDLTSRLHTYLLHALSSSPGLSVYASNFELLSRLFRDSLRSYFTHLVSFYSTVLSSLYSSHAQPAWLRFLARHTHSASFLAFLRCCVVRLLSASGRLFSIANWLLCPTLFIRLLYRHTLALTFFFLVHLTYQSAVQPSLSALHAQLRSLFIHPSYLHKEHTLERKMQQSITYRQWKRAASQLDRLQGAYRWKENSRSPYYDCFRVRDDLQQFRYLVDSRDVKGIMQYSRARLYRNLVGINDRRLYGVLRAGTKRLIEEYISEVVRALQLVCVIESDEVSAADKLAFFNETRHAFGRSALLLSGGATLGLYHTGVIKALHDNHLLPRVLSGASVGAIVVAMLGTRTDEEIRRVFSEDAHLLALNFFPPDAESTQRTFTRLLTTGTLMDINVLRACVRANVPNMTFQEAYDRSGRIINIVVSPAITSGNQDSLRLLNYLTAPNVLVWSAALASCAIPGIYAPVELMCMDEDGVERKWLEGDVRWQDGSVQADLPMERLRELFNINHFIVSQVNPHVLPFLRPITGSAFSSTASLPFSLLARLIDFLSASIKTTLLNLLSAVPLPFQSPIRFMLDQTYVGDITITPHLSAHDYALLLKNPTSDRLTTCLHQSEQATWRLLAMIKGACEIEMALDDGVRRMRGQLIMQEMAEARKVERLSRVRSWSTDFDRREKDDEAKEMNGGGSGDHKTGEDEVDQSDETEPSVSSIEEEGEELEQDERPPLTKAQSAQLAQSTLASSKARRPLQNVHTQQATPPPAVSSSPLRNGHGGASSASSRTGAHPSGVPPQIAHLHLPSTNHTRASHISGLDGRNAASALTHRSTGESVAHAYVLANKSFKRGATESSNPQPHSRSAAVTPHNRHSGEGSRDEPVPLSPPPYSRARTPPPASSLAAESNMSYDELISTRQTSARLQQLLQGSGVRGQSASNVHADESSKTADVFSPPPRDASLKALTLPSLVSFRPVNKRHISERDLQRMAGAGDETDSEDEERGWNAMMVRSDSSATDDSTDEDDTDEKTAARASKRAAPSHSESMAAARASGDGETDDSVLPPPNMQHSSSVPASRLAFFASLLPFPRFQRSVSSRSPAERKAERQQQQAAGKSVRGKHSASHATRLNIAGGRGGSSGRLSGRSSNSSQLELKRTLSVGELCSDLPAC